MLISVNELMCFLCLNAMLKFLNRSFFLFLTQSGTHSASLDKQRQLQSAAQSFYQQVVHVLKHRVSAETENPGLCCKMFYTAHATFKVPCSQQKWR